MEAVTISEKYREEMKKTHEKYTEYGSASIFYAPLINKLINDYGIKDLLDFGAGKQRLLKELKPDAELAYTPYEPADEHYNKLPTTPFEFVVCVDAVEHFEPEYLEATVEQLAKVTDKLCLITTTSIPAKKILSDGRNAHLTQEKAPFWFALISKYFEIRQFQYSTEDSFFFLCQPKIG